MVGDERGQDSKGVFGLNVGVHGDGVAGKKSGGWWKGGVSLKVLEERVRARDIGTTATGKGLQVVVGPFSNTMKEATTDRNNWAGNHRRLVYLCKCIEMGKRIVGAIGREGGGVPEELSFLLVDELFVTSQPLLYFSMGFFKHVEGVIFGELAINIAVSEVIEPDTFDIVESFNDSGSKVLVGFDNHKGFGEAQIVEAVALGG